jgi:hypothetical protein
MNNLSQKSKEWIDFYVALGAWAVCLFGASWLFRTIIFPFFD